MGTVVVVRVSLLMIIVILHITVQLLRKRTSQISTTNHSNLLMMLDMGTVVVVRISLLMIIARMDWDT